MADLGGAAQAELVTTDPRKAHFVESNIAEIGQGLGLYLAPADQRGQLELVSPARQCSDRGRGHEPDLCLYARSRKCAEDLVASRSQSSSTNRSSGTMVSPIACMCFANTLIADARSGSC